MVAYWVTQVARKFEVEEKDTQSMFLAAMFHDIGKLGVPGNILSKPGPLTMDEWEVMKLHPTIGANIVSSQHETAHVAPTIYAHQEKYDGTGYPDGLQGKEIPLGARILTVADAYQAMTENRVYRPALSHEEATIELKRCIGKQFDPEVVQAFLEVVNGKQSPIH